MQRFLEIKLLMGSAQIVTKNSKESERQICTMFMASQPGHFLLPVRGCHDHLKKICYLKKIN